jgi:uncharacterized protein (TIGR02996 family)
VATAEQERAAFLAAILAAPEDDTPRFVYADWLEEHGEEARAEFIRVQCELARREHTHTAGDGADVWHRETQALRHREQELLGRGIRRCLHCGWHAPVPHGGWGWDFRRGFVGAVTCTAADWLAHGPAVVAAQPVMRVALGDKRPWRGPATQLGFAWARNVPRRLGVPMCGNVAVLPAELYDATAAPRRSNTFVLYPSAAEARDALSAACLAWARGGRDL